MAQNVRNVRAPFVEQKTLLIRLLGTHTEKFGWWNLMSKFFNGRYQAPNSWYTLQSTNELFGLYCSRKENTRYDYHSIRQAKLNFLERKFKRRLWDQNELNRLERPTNITRIHRVVTSRYLLCSGLLIFSVTQHRLCIRLERNTGRQSRNRWNNSEHSIHVDSLKNTELCTLPVGSALIFY